MYDKVKALKAAVLLALAGKIGAAYVVGGAGVPRISTRSGSIIAVSTQPETATVWEGEAEVRVADGVLKQNARGRAWVDQRPRPRRNRKSETMRRMVRENIVTSADFIYPL